MVTIPVLEISLKIKGRKIPYDMTAYSLLREKIIDVLDSLTERDAMFFPFASDCKIATAGPSKKLGANSR